MIVATAYEVFGPGYVVSTETEAHGVVEARGCYLQAALVELCRRLSDLGDEIRTVETITVRYEGS